MNPKFEILATQLNYPSAGRNHYWWICAAFCGLAFVVSFFDISIATFNRHGEIPGDLRRILHMSELFAHGTGVLLAASVVFVFANFKRQFIPRLVACALWPGLIVQAVKHLVQRIRPGKLVPDFPETANQTFYGTWLNSGELNRVYDLQAFPSGHTATVVGLAIGMSWLFPKGRLFFFTLAVLAAIQRISSGSHWASDVLVGAAIGFLGAGALTQNWGLGRVFQIFEHRMTQRLVQLGKIRPLKEQGPDSQLTNQPPSRKQAA